MVTTNALSVMWLHRIAVKERRVKTQHSQLAQKNREKYPHVAKIIDEIRKYFPGAKVVSIGRMSALELARLKKRSQSPTNHE